MKNIQLFQNSNVDKLKQKASEFLEKVLIESSDKNILLLLSGGSAFSILSPIINKGIGSNLTIGVLDERYSSDPKINNFSQLSETTFYTVAKNKGCQFIDTRINNFESIEDLSLRFEKELKFWKENNPEGVIIITQGMGPDGHTAGIMPYPEDKNLFNKLFEVNHLVIGYDAGNKNDFPKRVATTLPFLRSVDVSIMFVVGESKEVILNKILKENIPLNIFPAGIIKEMKKVHLFTDINIKNDI